MKLGATSFINSKMDVEEFLSILISQSLQYVELKCDWRACDPEFLELSAIREWEELLHSYALHPSLHACYIDLNLASLSDLVRTASVKRVTKCVQFAAEIGASYVTIHPGKFSRDHHKSLFPRAYDRAVESINELARAGEEQNVMLALENAPNGTDRGVLIDPETMKACLDSMDSRMVGILLDLGHAHTHGLDPLAFLCLLSPHICALHIHNNDGRNDSHNPLYEGKMNYPSLLNGIAATHDHYPIHIEMHKLDDLISSREYLKRYGV